MTRRFRTHRGWPHALALAPAAIMAVAWLARLAIQPFGDRPLDAPLSGFPNSIATFERAGELAIPDQQRQRLQADELLHREYRDSSGQSLAMYVAYYGRQTGGSGIHSPSNCLPGSGWEPVEHDRVRANTIYGPVEINRYLIEHGSGGRALVYYWYQGRGRVMADEYRVKFELVRDAILDRRTDDGLVRLVFPLGSRDEDLGAVDAVAARVVPAVVENLSHHLPG